jgi:hypothetical protein
MHHPGFDQPVRASLIELSPDPDTQVQQVTSIMRDFAVQDASTPHIQQDSKEALQFGPDPVTGVWNYTKSKIQFVRDESAAADFLQNNNFARRVRGDEIVEVLIRPVDMSLMTRNGKRGQEDCDGFAMYAGSLFTALGIPWRFATVACDSRDPSIYSHVYVVAFPDGDRVAVDCSHGEYPGWEVPIRYRYQEWGDSSWWAVVLAGLVGFALWKSSPVLRRVFT